MKYTKKNKSYKITKRNYSNRPNLQKMSKHGGGFVGWIKHIYHMHKFNNFIQKFAKTKKELKSEYDSFNAESEFYERDAKRKSELVTDYLVQSKINILLNLQDTSEPPFKNNPILTKGVKKDQKLTSKKKKEIRSRIKRLDKEHKDNRGEYKRMNKKFNKNIDRFEKTVGSYTELAGFLEKVDSLYKKYSRLKGKDKKNLSKKHLRIIKRFEKNNENYKKVYSFTESYMDKTNKFVNAYTELRRKAEFYNEQFNNNKIAHFDEDITKWGEEIKKFYDALMECNQKGKEFSKKYETNILRCNNIFRRLRSTENSEKVRDKMIVIRNIKELLTKCLKHQNDINDLIEVLKINFLKNEPAVRLQFESNLVYAKAFMIEKWLKEINGYLPKLGKSI